jgi:phenylalanyl-tRNA synthetase beta chain
VGWSGLLRDATVVNTDTTVAGFNQPTVSGWLAGLRAAIRNQLGLPKMSISSDVMEMLSRCWRRFWRSSYSGASRHASGSCLRLSLVMSGFYWELHPQWRQDYGLAHALVLLLIWRRCWIVTPTFSPNKLQLKGITAVPETVTHAALM